LVCLKRNGESSGPYYKAKVNLVMVNVTKI
jgi:hypothetical protein